MFVDLNEGISERAIKKENQNKIHNPVYCLR